MSSWGLPAWVRGVSCWAIVSGSALVCSLPLRYRPTAGIFWSSTLMTPLCISSSSGSCCSRWARPCCPGNCGKDGTCVARWRQSHRLRHSPVVLPGQRLPRVPRGRLVEIHQPLWQQGFALYATLRLPIAYAPDFWQPQHLPFLQVMNYLALVVEPLIPMLLLCRPGHPGKWCGLLCQLGFHLGILLTLPLPFVNLGLLGTSVLFFAPKSCSGCGGVKPIRWPCARHPASIVPGGWRWSFCWCSVWQWRVAHQYFVLYQPAYAPLGCRHCPGVPSVRLDR